MNINTWSTKTLENGQCQLLNFHGDVIATFVDWQVAEKVVKLQEDCLENMEIIDQKDERIAELVEEINSNESYIADLKETSEQDHRTILDLEKEIDELKTKLWNLSHE